MVIGLFLLIVTAGVVIALIAFQRFGTGDVKGELGGYRIVDDETVGGHDHASPATIRRCRRCASCGPDRSTATRPAAARSWCRRPPQTSVVIDAVVKSTKPPVVGDIYGCGIDVPRYLVAP